MTPDPRPVVFLAHASFGAGAYVHHLEALRHIEAGLQAAFPSLRFLRALGRTPEDQPSQGQVPTVDCLRTLARRLLTVDEPRPWQVWVVSPPDFLVTEQLELAGQVGIEVVTLDPLLVDGYLIAGAAGRRAAACRSTTPLPVDRAQPRQIFRSPEEVAEAYWQGAEAILGARGLPLEPRQGGGNPDAAQARIECCGIRIAAAAAVVREAQAGDWTPKMTAVWELRGPGAEFEEVAQRLGYADKSGPWYQWQKCLGAIAEALRDRRDAQRTREEVR